MLKRAVANSKDNFTYKMALASITRNLGMYGEAAWTYSLYFCMEIASFIPITDSNAS